MSTRTRLFIEGMSCGGCAQRVTQALASVEGVDEVEVDVAGQQVAVEHDVTRADRSRLTEAVLGAGYGVRPVADQAVTRTGACHGAGGCGCS